MNRIKQAVKLHCIFLLIIFLNCCKTSKNGYSKIPQVKYDLEYMYNMTSELAKTNDTLVVLTFGGGYMKGIEHNFYSIKKNRETIIVQRISSFQKFKPVELASTNFPWVFIRDNFDKLVLDSIKDYKEIKNNDGTILFLGSVSHGKTISLTLKLDNSSHEIFLAPLVDNYNIGNINIDLIDKVKATILTLDYESNEQIRYKREK